MSNENGSMWKWAFFMVCVVCAFVGFGQWVKAARDASATTVEAPIVNCDCPRPPPCSPGGGIVADAETRAQHAVECLGLRQFAAAVRAAISLEMVLPEPVPPDTMVLTRQRPSTLSTLAFGASTGNLPIRRALPFRL